MKNTTKRILSTGVALALLITLTVSFLTMPISAAGEDSFKGWRRLWTGDASLMSIDEEGALAIESGTGEQHLVLNADTGSSYVNKTAFPFDAMENFTATYEIKTTNFGTDGKISFILNGRKDADMGDEAIQLVWSGENGGELSLKKENVGTDDPYGTIDDWVFELEPDDENWVTFEIIKDGSEIQIIIDGDTRWYDDIQWWVDDEDFLGSGYIGIQAVNVDCSIRNMTITNDTTGDGAVFFEVMDGWWNHPGKNPFKMTPDGWLSFDSGSGSADEQHIVLNQDYGGFQSSAYNRAKFGQNDMTDYTAEYDLKATSLVSNVTSKIAFAINGQQFDHMGYYAVQLLWRGDRGGEVLIKKEYAGGAETNGMIGDVVALSPDSGWVHFKIIKSGANLTVFINDAEVISVDMATQVDDDYLGSGFIGFQTHDAAGSVRNFRITNDTTGAVQSYFPSPGTNPGEIIEPDPVIPPPPKELSGWQVNARYPGQKSHVDLQDGMLAFGGEGEKDIVLNGGGSSAENTEKFAADNMSRYTAEYDMQINKLVGKMGYRFVFTFNGYTDVHLGDRSIGFHANDSISCLYKERVNNDPSDIDNPNDPPAYGEMEGGSKAPPPRGGALSDGSWHHVKLQKNDNLLSVWIDGEAILLNIDLYDYGCDYYAGSGYVGFLIQNMEGYLCNMKLTNDTTGESTTFFKGYGKDITGWRAAGGDTTIQPQPAGMGVRGVNAGQCPDDNSAIRYILPLDLSDFSFTVRPESIVTTEDDSSAWMGPAIVNQNRYFDMTDADRASGFVTQIFANKDGSAVMKILSLLPDGGFGDETESIDLDSFIPDESYTFGYKMTDDGLEVYVDGEKAATLDWLTGVYEENIGYFSFSASQNPANGVNQVWVIEKMNGHDAISYESDAVDDRDDGNDDDDDYDDGDDYVGGDNDGNDSDDLGNNSDTGDVSVLIPITLLTVSSGALCLKKKKV